MGDPSEYELAAWDAIQRFQGRPLSQGMRWVGEKAADGAAAFGVGTADFLEKHPKAELVVSRGKELVGKGVRVVESGFHRAADALPDWSGAAFTSVRKTVGRVSRAGLSPNRIVARHKKHDHPVASLADLRRLDLEQIDEVRGHGASWYYPALAALSGAGAGLVISGGEFVVTASAGVGVAPSGGAIVGAFAGDAAIVLGLSSRVVGQVALDYGYEPEQPAEKLFVMSIVNAGSAMSSAAKTAAMADISRLTQALVRGKTWAVLNESVVAKVSHQAAKAFGFRLTQKGLGKAIPAFGIVVGGTLNWTTLESIVDAADIAYRRRFLLEKYPQLATRESSDRFSDIRPDAPDDADQPFSVLEELADAGGPDFR
ncbi:EcsC family protein [Micropruina sonneratiae]|uniref:EcsC family protein n=1 Tax=Micropruina sonneratiae TaxID=2986940 RepID=UPI00222760E6|nr:EcsC family protein [Micropruina sp. KQZ13P-5]MCW3158593.1 EcsC family protein [Micropruina sp. KQZ13P-5]